jgi:nucleotide-binding universal stress UspA family protein
MPAQTIIVGVEGSSPSADALAMADLLAGPLKARVLVVHTHPYGPISRVLSEGKYERLVREVAESTFFQLKDQLEDDREREMRVVAARSPAAGLSQIAEREHASLIVVGPSHRAGLGRVRPGSVGERLLSGASSPVGVAPRGYAQAGRSLGVIGSAFDSSPESHLALDWSSRLARASASRLVVVSAHTPMVFGHIPAGLPSPESVNQVLRRELRQEQEQVISALDQPAEGVFTDGEAAEVLERASHEVDLLVLGSRGYGPLRATVLGSVSQQVLRNANCPVVVTPRGVGAADEESGSADVPEA